jgi:hypothetical protein
MAIDKKGYLKPNFFEGLIVKEEDLNDILRYTVDKHRLYNQHFHSPGVVSGFLGELRVTARERGDMSFEVAAGYAIDGQGNDIFLWEPEIRTIDPTEWKLPQTVYIAVEFVAEPLDFIVNKANPQYKGHRRVLETARVQLTGAEPDLTKTLELARVRLAENSAVIRDAVNPLDPGVGEIDLRFVARSMGVGALLPPYLRSRFAALLAEKRRYFGALARNYPIVAARDVKQAVATAEMLVGSPMMGLREVFRTLTVIVDLEKEVVDEIQASADLAQRDGFKDFQQNVGELINLLREPLTTVERLRVGLDYQSRASSGLARFLDAPARSVPLAMVTSPVVTPAPVPVPVAEAPAIPPGTKQVSWEQLTKLSFTGDPPSQIAVDGVVLSLIDQIQPTIRQSEESHQFVIGEVRAESQGTQSNEFSYPDGTRVQARGRWHLGGHAEWVVRNVKPGKDLVLMKRIDMVNAGLVAEVYVNDHKVPETWDIKEADRKNRWRNWLFRVPADLVTSDTVKIRHVTQTAKVEANYYGLWFYQAE